MSESRPEGLSRNGVPVEGIEDSIAELVDLYGGEMKASREREREFTLPVRRGVAAGGSIACTISWVPDDGENATVKLSCDQDVEGPRLQRVLLLVAGVAGGLLFMLWPFFPADSEFATLAWLGGAVAIAVYLMTVKRPGGGIAHDFLQRLAARQRAAE